jgi:hypothetical protein
MLIGYAAAALSTLTLVILVGVAWLSYPLAGAAGVAADVLGGRRAKGAGFSFLPEMIVFPAAFFGVAGVIDYFAMPWGRRVVGGVCVVMFGVHVYLFVRGWRRMRSARREGE